MKRLLIRMGCFCLLLLVVGFCCSPPHARAGMSPVHQLTLSVGGQGRWLDTPHLNSKPDFEAAGNAALTLTPHVDVTAGVAAGIGGSYLREQADIRLAAKENSDNETFSVWLGGGYYWSDDFEDGLDGWAAKAGLGWQPSLAVPVVVGVTAAATPNDGRSSITVSGTWTLKRGGQ